jgi:hypothetical protein
MDLKSEKNEMEMKKNWKGSIVIFMGDCFTTKTNHIIQRYNKRKTIISKQK